MTDVPQFLEGLRQIDAVWLEAVLEGAGFRDSRVLEFSLVPVGAGNVSDTVRVDMKLTGPDAAPGSVICKFSASNQAAHAHGIGSGSYVREVETYRSFASAGKVCRVPRMFWVSGGRDGINLVVEDLTRTTRPGDQIAGCSVEEAFSVVEELARLHARFFPLAAADAPDWALTMAATADYWSNAIREALPLVERHDRGRLDGREWMVIREAAAKAGEWYRNPVSRGTLTHGDPRVDNILFEDTPEGISAVILDWQMTGWRNPMHDVGYFLSGSISTEDRRNREQDLLAHYHERFGPDRGYSLADIEADYRVQLLSGLMTTLAAYSLLSINEPVELLLMTLLKRNLAAAYDWSSLEVVGASR